MRGVRDDREREGLPFMHWSAKATPEGVAMAAKITGGGKSDRFTIFFDTREPELLGTVGPYYWMTMTLGDDGTLKIEPGETSPRGADVAKPRGRWTLAEKVGAGRGVEGSEAKGEEGGDERHLEWLIPYSQLELNAWPASGDLGCSIWWRHMTADGHVDLHWSEDGHPWNPRWFGVIRLTDDPDARMPYMVRVK